MKILSRCASVPAVLFIIALSASVAPAKSYEYRTTGIRLELPEQWDVYTSKENAPDHFKSAFRNNAGDARTMLVANHPSQQAYVRLLSEPFSGTVSEYFDLLYIGQKDKIDIIRARYDVVNDVIQWEFRTRAGQINLAFIETIAKQGGAVVRLGCWTVSPLIEKYRPIFIQITEGTALLRKGQKEQSWSMSWKDLHKNLEGGDIDYVTLAKPLPEQAALECSRAKQDVLWQVKGTKNSVYLFGSIHLGRQDFYPLAAPVESAFDRSEHLAVELDSTSETFKSNAAGFMSRARLQEGKTLRDVLSPGVYRKLTETLERMGLPLDAVDRLKPWVTAITLTALKFQSMGYVPDYGVDQYFLDKAKTKKKVLEFESFDEQVRIFESVGEERFLAYTLLSLNVLDVKAGKLITAWRCGDIKTMKSIIFDDLDSMALDDAAAVYEKLFFDRNRKMADKITEFLQKDGDYFVVVGAGHLIGDKNIVDLLRAKGYTVTGPTESLPN